MHVGETTGVGFAELLRASLEKLTGKNGGTLWLTHCVGKPSLTLRSLAKRVDSAFQRRCSAVLVGDGTGRGEGGRYHLKHARARAALPLAEAHRTTAGAARARLKYLHHAGSERFPGKRVLRRDPVVSPFDRVARDSERGRAASGAVGLTSNASAGRKRKHSAQRCLGSLSGTHTTAWRGGLRISRH